jgi:D-3-phosphoglycerate dehydrogenase
MGTGAGTYVDLDDAARRRVQVYTTPGYGDQSVAEHAFALLFSAARGIVAMDRSIRTGAWEPSGGRQLKGEKIAVVGLGGIGACMADLALGIGMEVAAWSRTPREHPAFVAELDEALEGAGAVSLHLSLNGETVGILDRRRLLLPKRGFILVNTARAGLVDEAAFLQMLAEGQIGHAALDVFPEEPLPPGNPYQALENATLTAHAAYMTDAAYEELWLRTLKAYQALLPLCAAREAASSITQRGMELMKILVPVKRVVDYNVKIRVKPDVGRRPRQRRDVDEPVRRDRGRGSAATEGCRQGDGGGGLDRPYVGGRVDSHRSGDGR